MAVETGPTDGVLRRAVLKAGAVAAGALGMVTPAIGAEHEDEENDTEVDDEYGDVGDEPEVDEPEGFEVEILAEHAPFVDDVAARFCLSYADDPEGAPIVVDLEDASTVIVGEVRWEPGARSGWHRHPGMSIINMVEGEIVHTMEDDCVPRTYTAGDAWMDPGHVHTANSEDGARAYITFFGIPEGEPATEWVEPVDC